MATVRIVAVDDNPVNLKVVAATLSHAGYEVVTATSGAEALARIAEVHPNLVIMDVMMPEMDGFEATRMIRQDADGRNSGTPIIALTANAMTHQVYEYLASGMDGFVAKPIEVERLFAALDAALSLPATPARRTGAA